MSGGSIFGGGGGGGGPFSSGAQSVGQSGFGAAPSFQSPKPASGFGSAPVFGNSPAFGGSPAFGTSPTFGSPNKTFGATTPVASPGGGFGGQGNVFENLANQNTMSFGNLAQGQPQGMAPSFGSPQPQQQNSNPTFGGNAFSSWR